MAQMTRMGAGWKRAGLMAALVLLLAWPAAAQEDEFRLNVRRTFGYGGGSQIQGNFRLEIIGPADLTQVTFTLDGQPLETVTAPPFELAFVTDRHPPGWHEFGATGTTAGGQTLTAASRRFEFVTGEQARQAMLRIMVPTLAVVGLLVLVSAGMPLLAAVRGGNRPPAGAHRNYGLLGGTICPKCGRPFGRHWWGLNMLTGQLDRCDHCGRWSIVRALPPNELARAEAAELEAERGRQAENAVPVSEAERLRRALDESRYQE